MTNGENATEREFSPSYFRIGANVLIYAGKKVYEAFDFVRKSFENAAYKTFNLTANVANSFYSRFKNFAWQAFSRVNFLGYGLTGLAISINVAQFDTSTIMPIVLTYFSNDHETNMSFDIKNKWLAIRNLSYLSQIYGASEVLQQNYDFKENVHFGLNLLKTASLVFAFFEFTRAFYHSEQESKNLKQIDSGDFIDAVPTAKPEIQGVEGDHVRALKRKKVSLDAGINGAKEEISK